MTDNIDKQPRDDSEPAEYRPDTLLAPATLLKEQPHVLDVLNRHLESSGISIERESPGDDPCQRLAVPLLLRRGSDAEPGSALDATGTLERLHAAGGTVAEAAQQLSPDRILCAPDPPDISGQPTNKGHAAGSRVPIAVLPLWPPRRRPLSGIREGRRPVVAVLDTGVAEHAWLDRGSPDSDAFCVDAEDYGWSCSLPILESGSRLHSHTGHGTFIAGVIRQLTADARVLSLRVMNDCGKVNDSLLTNALSWLLARVSNGNADDFVDVICLAMGYKVEIAANRDYTRDRLRPLLWDLGDLGVRVVASAGNKPVESRAYPAAFPVDQRHDPPTYPAAFAVDEPLSRTGLVSVGAKKPNGSRAAYSNRGDWVTDWELGTGIVSTFPRVPGEASSPLGELWPLDHDFSSGFIRWSGTSFAAAGFAARLAGALLTGEEDALLDVSPGAACDRADHALMAVRRP